MIISNTPIRMIFAATVDIYIEIRNGLKIKVRFYSQHCFIIKIVFMTYFASLNTKCNKYLLCKQNPKCYSKLTSWKISKVNINHEMKCKKDSSSSSLSKYWKPKRENQILLVIIRVLSIFLVLRRQTQKSKVSY